MNAGAPSWVGYEKYTLGIPGTTCPSVSSPKSSLMFDASWSLLINPPPTEPLPFFLFVGFRMFTPVISWCSRRQSLTSSSQYAYPLILSCSSPGMKFSMIIDSSFAWRSCSRMVSRRSSRSSWNSCRKSFSSAFTSSYLLQSFLSFLVFAEASSCTELYFSSAAADSSSCSSSCSCMRSCSALLSFSSSSASMSFSSFSLASAASALPDTSFSSMRRS
mmetsp:Transcript_20403/g.45977  ORF Transcript_20403/g.45977 Transcript_20403/m.45977 type:complete len:218 (+) Transcript_20403:482-1135(+)